MKSDQKVIDRSLGRHSNPSTEQVESAVARVWKDLAAEVRETPGGTAFHAVEDRPAWRSRWTVSIAAAALLVVGILTTAIVRNVTRLSGPTASVETVDGKLYRVSGKKAYSIAAGERISAGETVRSEGGAVLVLADESRVEMRSGAEFTVDSASDGARIRLSRGSIIVTAEEQRSGHLYVETKDVTVSVVGTVFLVNVEEEGSRVAVVQGEVRVLQSGIEKTLLPGDQVATTPALQLRPLSEEVSWSRNAPEHIALLARTQPIPPLPVFQGAAPAGISGFQVSSVKVESEPPNGARAADLQGLSCTGRDGVWWAMMSTGSTSFSAPRGRCVGQYMNIQMLVSAVHEVPLARVVGAPNWRTPGHPFEYGFRIEAIAENPSTATTAQLKQMLQDFLAARFGLKVRTELRDADGVALVAAGAEARLRRAFGTEETLPTFEDSNRQQVIRGKTSIKKLADFLSQVPIIRCAFVDKTGLPGIYDYTLTLRLIPVGDAIVLGEGKILDEAKINESKKITAAGGRAAVSGSQGCGPTQTRSGPDGLVVYEYNPSIKAAIEQQLGLRLEPQKVSVEHIVIDEVHAPTGN